MLSIKVKCYVQILYKFPVQLELKFFILGMKHVETTEGVNSVFIPYSEENLQCFQVSTTVLLCEHSMGFLSSSLSPSFLFLSNLQELKL